MDTVVPSATEVPGSLVRHYCTLGVLFKAVDWFGWDGKQCGTNFNMVPGSLIIPIL